MFSASKPTITSFESSWKSSQEVASEYTQTEEGQSNDVECQVVSSREISCQTVEEETPNYGTPEYNESSLVDFLRKIGPKVERELEKAQRSRAFVGYSELEASTQHKSKCLHTLRWQHVPREHIVNCMDWSSTGSVIGVGYGAQLHEDWCYHKGTIAVWNINRPDFAPNTPEQLMEVSTCVTCISFHPSNPAWLAAGNMSGEVMVFDFSRAQEVSPFCSAESGKGHITCLKWSALSPSTVIKSRTSYSLISTTMGGAILAWTINASKETMNLSTGFLVEHQDVPREVRSRLVDSGEVGITSIAFNYEDPTIFVVGTEGGAVLLCSTLSQIPSNSEIGGIKLLKCVTSSISPHAGRVLEVDSSPHHRHALHTLGSDNNLRFYSLLQPNKPVSVIYSEVGLTCSQWSPSKPLTVVVGTIGGNLSFYNFGSKNCESVLNLNAAEKPSPVACLVFNKKNMNTIACGDQLGRVFIWDLPESVVSPSPADQATLSKMVQITAE